MSKRIVLFAALAAGLLYITLGRCQAAPRMETVPDDLRDWFAGQAMEGFFAGRDPERAGGVTLVKGNNPNNYEQSENTKKAIAEWSYRMADSMLEARKIK